MKLLDLFEKTRVNIEVLDAIASNIIANAKYEIAHGETFMVKLDPKVVEQLRSRFGEEQAILAEYISKYVPVVFQNKSGGALGAFYQHAAQHNDSRDDVISVFIPQDPENPGAAISPRQLQQNRAVKSSLMHELRHVAQRTRFGAYYQKQVTDMSSFDTTGSDGKLAKYRVDPMEIDAAFTHIITNNSDIDDPREFAKKVVADLSAYKTLTDQQRQHYYRKAATYAVDRGTQDGHRDDLQGRLTKKKKLRADEIGAILKDAVKPLSQLSSIGMGMNYNTTFPGPVIVNGHLKMTRGDMSVDRPDLFIFGASLIYKWMKDNDVDLSIDDLFGKIRSVPDEWWNSAIELINTHGMFERLDRKFLAGLVKTLQQDYQDRTMRDI